MTEKTNLSSTGSIYESFNARNLSPIQVAKTFIPPHQFRDLVNRQHSLVVGPRGSGKTTLLKMLQLPALSEWEHEDADEVREGIDFTAAFIASDVSWGEQLVHLDGAALSSTAKHVLGRAAFTTHVMLGLVQAFRDCCSDRVHAVPTLRHQAVTLPRDKEGEVVRQLALGWKLEDKPFSFGALKISLMSRVNEILAIAKRESLSADARAIANLRSIEFLHLDALAAARFGTSAFSEIAECESKNWALLFDELEIAPTEIQRSLLASLRSGERPLLLKLSLSPFDRNFLSGADGKGATARDDFKAIELWYPRKEGAYPFSEQLVASMIAADLPGSPTPQQVFGESEFDPPSGEERNRTYSVGGKAYERFRLLAERDDTFASYLSARSISLNSLNSLPEKERAELIRRVTSIVVVRETFRGTSRNSANKPASGRSRKNPTLYSGVHSLFAIAEGNPRWLIGIFKPLIQSARKTDGRSPPEVQSEEIAKATHTFKALLATFPYKLGGRNVGLSYLLDKIGGNFYRGVVVDDFSAQPPLSFKVDKNCDDEVVNALERALNAGAIVYVPPPTESPVLSSLRDRRFRLSYMLGAAYRLPLLLGLEANLSRILSRPFDLKAPELFED